MLRKMISELKQNKRELTILFFYTIVILFFCSKMSPFYPIQEWSDVNLYFNIGKAIMNGQSLYTESFDPKGPIIFFIYGLGYLISNDSFLGVFFIQILIWSTLSFSAYFCARLFLDKTYSLIVAAFFLLILLSHTSEGGSAEEFITAYMTVSFYLFIRYFRNPDKHALSHMYVHGVMWGLAFFTKFPLTAFWIFPLIAIGLILILKKEYKNLLLNILSFVAGGATVACPLALYFISKGILSEAIDTYFFLNSSFRVGTFEDIIHKVAISFYQRLRFETIEFSFILLGAFIFPLIYLKNNIARIAIALSFLSIFTIVFMAGYVYYYSIPYYLFAIGGLIIFAKLISKYITIKKHQWLVIVLALLTATSGSIYRKSFFGKYNKNKGVTVVEKFLPTIMKEKDKSLVNLGFDDANALFTYANIMPNTKYFTAPNLPHEAYPKLRNEQTLYIKEGKTMFVVLAERTINAEYFFNLKALQDNYEIVDRFKEYYAWHNTDRYYYLYKRKEQ